MKDDELETATGWDFDSYLSAPTRFTLPEVRTPLMLVRVGGVGDQVVPPSAVYSRDQPSGAPTEFVLSSSRL